MDYDTYEKRKVNMKVFISWSGEKSKKVALILRDWLPTVIQALEPFVSSEDIEKGARWNTEIAQELKESSFGLICVTKDNLTAPWLNFEAGALSKTINNSYVAPLLFDVKPSELKGSPISQFQATSFNIEDIKRLVETLNTATGNCLSSTRLDKAFELCYPDLEKSISELRSSIKEDEGDGVGEATPPNLDPNILEELLETARNTQRLLGNTDSKLYGNIEEVQKKTDEIISKMERHYEREVHRNHRRINPMYIRELIYGEYENIFPYNILIILSYFKDDFPWLYDVGNEVVVKLSSNSSDRVKKEALNKFRDILDITFSHPVMRDMYMNRKESMVMLEELYMSLMRGIDRTCEEDKRK